MLSSDEDDIDEMNTDYLANLSRMAVQKSAQEGIEVMARIEANSYEDSDEVRSILLYYVDRLLLPCRRKMANLPYTMPDEGELVLTYVSHLLHDFI